MSLPRFPLILFCLMLTTSGHTLAADNQPETIPYGSNTQAGRHADINGIKMYYETYGSGDPLLVIHGNGQSIASMHYQVAHFARNYQVIVADSRGHGKSGLGKGQLTYI